MLSCSALVGWNTKEALKGGGGIRKDWVNLKLGGRYSAPPPPYFSKILSCKRTDVDKVETCAPEMLFMLLAFVSQKKMSIVRGKFFVSRHLEK